MKGFLESLQKRLSEIDKELNPSAATDPDGKQPLYSGGSQGMKDPYGGFQFSLMTPTGGGSPRRRAEAAALGVDPEAISQAAPKQKTPEEERQEDLKKIFPGRAISQGPRPPEIFFPGVNQMLDQAGQQVNVYEIEDYFPEGDMSELDIGKDPVLGSLSKLMRGLSIPFTGAYDILGEGVKQVSRVGGLFETPQNFETRSFPPFGAGTRDLQYGFDVFEAQETPNIFVRDARFKEQTARQMGEFAQAYKDFQSVAPQMDPATKKDVGERLLKALDRIATNLDSEVVHPVVKTNLMREYNTIRAQIINEYLDGVPQPTTWTPTSGMREDLKTKYEEGVRKRKAAQELRYQKQEAKRKAREAKEAEKKKKKEQENK